MHKVDKHLKKLEILSYSILVVLVFLAFCWLALESEMCYYSFKEKTCFLPQSQVKIRILLDKMLSERINMASSASVTYIGPDFSLWVY